MYIISLCGWKFMGKGYPRCHEHWSPTNNDGSTVHLEIKSVDIVYPLRQVILAQVKWEGLIMERVPSLRSSDSSCNKKQNTAVISIIL